MQTYGDWNYQNKPLCHDRLIHLNLSMLTRPSEQTQEEAPDRWQREKDCCGIIPIVEKEIRKKQSAKAASQRTYNPRQRHAI